MVSPGEKNSSAPDSRMMAFFLGDHVHAGLVEGAGGLEPAAVGAPDLGHDGFGENPLGLIGGQAKGGAQDLFLAQRGEVDADVGVLGEPVQERFQLVQVRRGPLDEEYVVLKVGGNLGGGGGDDDGFFTGGLEAVGQVTQLPGDDRLVVQAVVKVFEHKDRVALAVGLGDSFEGGFGIARVGQRAAARVHDGPEEGGNVPTEQAPLGFLAQALEGGDDPFLLVRGDPKHGEPGSKVNLNLFKKVHKSLRDVRPHEPGVALAQVGKRSRLSPLGMWIHKTHAASKKGLSNGMISDSSCPGTAAPVKSLPT